MLLQMGDKTMATTSITIRMDENLKKKAESLFEDMGLNMTRLRQIHSTAKPTRPDLLGPSPSLKQARAKSTI